MPVTLAHNIPVSTEARVCLNLVRNEVNVKIIFKKLLLLCSIDSEISLLPHLCTRKGKKAAPDYFNQCAWCFNRPIVSGLMSVCFLTPPKDVSYTEPTYAYYDVSY